LRAVNNLYLGLEANEKFGLLGFNGSGKSTTFKCITNELIYEEGLINLFGNNTLNSFENIRTIIGYCPQENPLFDFLTVKQTLEFYKSLKKSKISINEICQKFNLEKYINKYCINLSGGNKRKLTFAISLMNYPRILLLDEPSTGVDPESRRIMWKNINELSNNQNQYNMILSTHSMEEAEILCDNVSWLRSGNFICIGNPEELKIKFTSGYNLHIKFIEQKLNNHFSDIKKLSSIGIEGGIFIDNYTIQNQILIKYVNELYHVLIEFKDLCEKIKINQIGSDFSFDLIIYVKKDKQGELFSNILNMKEENDKLSEISINIEPLENILTKL
jgi:ABC-type multidrug transport system ATPase subunit